MSHDEGARRRGRRPSRRLGGPALLALVLAPVVGTANPGPVSAAPYDAADPATWSNRRLAGQLTHTCVAASDMRGARAHAAAGVGGITLLGDDAPRDLAAQLDRVIAAAPAGTPRPYVAGDEEGGRVQRLARLIYPLPSAEVMGRWSPSRIERTAHAYGRRMLALGVDMDFGPVADLAVPGRYMARMDRAFSADPRRVTAATAAWTRGMRRAGVLPVIKHWPGHGEARDSHTGAAAVPALRVLERRDMLPFDAAFRAGAPLVMVGHLTSAGLTEPGTPASLSPKALRYLRARTGPRTVIVTDSLTMAAATTALRITPARAAVRALRAGADWALVCSAGATPIITAVRAALDDGTLPRARAVASARRLLALKEGSGLMPR